MNSGRGGKDVAVGVSRLGLQLSPKEVSGSCGYVIIGSVYMSSGAYSKSVTVCP